jgi:hypothetical protein
MILLMFLLLIVMQEIMCDGVAISGSYIVFAEP